MVWQLAVYTALNTYWEYSFSLERCVPIGAEFVVFWDPPNCEDQYMNNARSIWSHYIHLQSNISVLLEIGVTSRFWVWSYHGLRVVYPYTGCFIDQCKVVYTSQLHWLQYYHTPGDHHMVHEQVMSTAVFERPLADGLTASYLSRTGGNHYR